MKLRLNNRVDEEIMKKITGGTLEVSRETSADEMECFPAAQQECPICHGTLLDYKFYVLGNHKQCRMGQKCLAQGCGYSWTFGMNLEYEE